MTTAQEFYNNLRKEISFLEDERKIENCTIQLLDSQKEMLYKFFLSLSKRTDIDEKMIKNLIVDVLHKPNIENGKVYEALVYAWLERNRIQYMPQYHVAREDCFKTSSQGYDADGILKEGNIVFDVKQFGLTLPHIENLRRKLQAKIPGEYYLTISGGKNISTKDLQTNFLTQVDDVAKRIMNERNRNGTDYMFKKDGLEFRAWNLKENSTAVSFSEFDPYEWAENNELYFMYHASQFGINSPYILFCPFDNRLVRTLFKEDGYAFLAFRTLCRRIFINLVRMDDKKISDYDGKARNDISVAAAARKISAIVFMDVSEEFDYQHCRVFAFQNPNADHKIAKHCYNTLFTYNGAKIDDFMHDNY